MNTQDTKNPATGVDSGACEQSTFSGADFHNYTQEPDKWQVKDNQRLCTDLTDFLMFRIEQCGRSENLVNAVHFIKNESELLAYAGEEQTND